ncbi:MAG: alpha/beta hydrolase [Lachnospiraceae bacterium]|nr:alpha/beta hydrolase [Lachnospiraceae bacterium]
MKYELIQLNKERNVTLTAYVTETEGEYRNVTARPAVIVIPGGGYQFCSDREADPVAMPFLAAGYDVFILRYSVGENAVWPTPLNDYDEAYEYIISRADEWKVMKDKIAVIGFSAGGHLAAAAATMAKHRPQAAILGYPVIREDTVQECEKTAPGIPEHVSYDTCPCFIFATRTDSVVPIQNTIDMLNALNQYQVSFECHIYSHGPHGFSTGDSSVQGVDTIIAGRARDWVEDSIKWLRDVMGEFGNDGLTKPVCKAHVSEDGNAWLSLDCSISRIFGNPEAVRRLQPLIADMKEKIPPFAPGMTFDDMMQTLGKMLLRDLLVERNIWTDRLDELDALLSEVPNI